MNEKLTIEELFDYTQTEKKLYTKILKSAQKIAKRIVLVSPEGFLKNSFARTDVTKEEVRHPGLHPTSPRKKKWALPFVDLMAKKGYSRGRALVCMGWKIEKIPVLVVGRTEKDIDEWIELTTPKKAVKKAKNG